MSETRGRPLEGIRVIDLTTFLSGPSATQLLGDLGAEVIKVESLEGDSSRAIAGPKLGGDSAYYLSINRNKQSIALDLKSSRGLQIAQQLIAGADVVIENFRPGVTDRLGLSAKSMLEKHPALVWGSISGFGQEGPTRNRPAYDMIVQALSGVMSLTGHPGSPAARLGIPAGDVVAGLYAVIGILAALRARDTTGLGRIVDVSMLRGQLSMLSYQALYTVINGVAPEPQGAAHDSIATYRSFRGSDGREFVVTANTPRMWESFCQVLGLDELIVDDRFVDASGRLHNKLALWALLETQVAQKTAAEWVDLLTAAQVPVALVKNVLEAMADAREADDGSLVTVHSEESEFENVATPIRFVDTIEVEPTYPPTLGENTRDILMNLGFSADDIESLVSIGVVGAATVAVAPAL